jgi:hypothetical protein
MRHRRLKRRRIAEEITRAVLDFNGPSEKLRFLWLRLWSYRDKLDRVAGKTQADWAQLFDYATERALRDQLSEAAAWNMLTIHAGVHGNPSLYVLHPPHRWSTEKQPKPALLPPKRSPASAVTRAGAAADDSEAGDAADRLLVEVLSKVPSDEVPDAPTQKSTI